jgi:hypothetical protein
MTGSDSCREGVFMLIQVIRESGDFRSTEGTSICRVNQWVLPTDLGKATPVAEAVEHFTLALGRAAPAVARGALAEPLEGLHAVGLQLVAIVTRGCLAVRSTRTRRQRAVLHVSMADYIVAPEPCYFRRAEGWGQIHRLGAACSVGHGDIVANTTEMPEKLFDIWWAPEVLARDFEFAIPWCLTCQDADDLGDAV